MSEKIMRENLMVLAQTYADANGWSLSTVSKRIHGRSDFLERYAAGMMSPTIKTYFLMVQRLRDDWPRRVPWPETLAIPRLGKKGD